MKFSKRVTIGLAAFSVIFLISGQAFAGKVIGNIGAVKVDHCGIAPGSCKGSVVVTKADGIKVTLQIDFGSKLYKKVKEPDRYILASLMITQLRAGDKVKADVVERKDGTWARAIVVQLKP
jgi:hypothetical protein